MTIGHVHAASSSTFKIRALTAQEMSAKRALNVVHTSGRMQVFLIVFIVAPQLPEAVYCAAKKSRKTRSQDQLFLLSTLCSELADDAPDTDTQTSDAAGLIPTPPRDDKAEEKTEEVNVDQYLTMPVDRDVLITPPI